MKAVINIYKYFYIENKTRKKKQNRDKIITKYNKMLIN